MCLHRHRIRWLVTVAILLPFTPAHGHPLGNDTIVHIDILWVLPDRVEFDLFLDYAEGPSSAYPEEIDTDRDGKESREEQQAWLKKKGSEILPTLRVTIDGQRVPVSWQNEAFDPNTGRRMPGIPSMIQIPGSLGMPTYRTLSRFAGAYPKPLAPGEHVLTFEDESFFRIKGLRRILLEKTEEVEFLAPHPDFLDPEGSAFLYDLYDPANMPAERSATIRFRIAGTAAEAVTATGPAAPASVPATTAAGPSGADTESNAVPAESNLPYPILDPRNDPAKAGAEAQRAHYLVAKLRGPWGLAVFLTVTALAFAWGAGHALMPGHAKTVVAAYLISQRGNYWHAVVLALIVTITHTALVIVVGVVIWFYQKSHPTLGPSLQLWLGILSGVLVSGMGVVLTWRAVTGRLAHHHHDHHHDHHDDRRSWFSKLFTHSHPHVHEASHGHGPHHHHHGHGDHHHHEHEHGHSHTHHHDLPHAHEHPHTRDHHHGPDHAHDHSHESTHEQTHGHAHEHGHAARPHGHDHASKHTPAAGADRPLTMRTLLILGITGGIVPCPAATIILFLGIGANVIGGALYAVGVFSLGLALTLMVVGFAALYSRRFAARVLSDAHHEGELTSTGQRILLQAVPAISGTLVTLLGLAIAANYIYLLRHGSSLIPWLG